MLAHLMTHGTNYYGRQCMWLQPHVQYCSMARMWGFPEPMGCVHVHLSDEEITNFAITNDLITFRGSSVHMIVVRTMLCDLIPS